MGVRYEHPTLCLSTQNLLGPSWRPLVEGIWFLELISGLAVHEVRIQKYQVDPSWKFVNLATTN